MVITGSLLFYAIPVRTYQSVLVPREGDLPDPGRPERLDLPQRRLQRRSSGWDCDAARRGRRGAGGRSLVLWACIIVAGRFIAYNWFDCDIQPQPAIFNCCGRRMQRQHEPMLLPIFQWLKRSGSAS